MSRDHFGFESVFSRTRFSRVDALGLEDYNGENREVKRVLHR